MPERERHPRHPGYVCIVDGCTRVEYKHELCNGHWRELPNEIKEAIMLDVVRAAHKAARRYDPQIRKLAKGMAVFARSPQP